MNEETTATSRFNLNDLTEDELSSIITEAQTLLRQMKARRANELRRQVEKTAADLGMTVAEFLGYEKKSRRSAPKGKVAPKYRNPEDPTQTWTGRGQKPVWLRNYVEQGFKLEDFLIKDADVE